uniref:Uncharacterized protein n=1 Tax=Gasterosteus aculeatus TaxID=69293 RepID=G3P887_GASAC
MNGHASSPASSRHAPFLFWLMLQQNQSYKTKSLAANPVDARESNIVDVNFLAREVNLCSRSLLLLLTVRGRSQSPASPRLIGSTFRPWIGWISSLLTVVNPQN